HVVREEPGQPSIIYIDRHLVHEGTSPQAFAGLRSEGRKVRRPDLTFAVMDHSVSTTDRLLPILDTDAKLQFEALERNCRETGVRLFDMHSKNQGIVHIIGPELGITQPGQTLVCGDSHTSTHGAFGTLAFGIGTSEVEHVLATQCLAQSRSKTLHILVHGKRPKGVTAKDIILAIIGKIGIGGGTGHVAEYGGEAIRALSMDGRMTVCNMTIEGGARAGMIAPDETTMDYVNGREHAPRGEQWDEAVTRWTALVTDPGARFDHEISIDADKLDPYVTWGTIQRQSEAECLDAVFRQAGFEWRDAGGSMSLGMNPDILGPGDRCASTSNRNFEGRQGSGGRTHLVSPPMAAAAAIAGHLVDVREFNNIPSPSGRG